MTITRDQMIEQLEKAEEATAKRLLREANRLQDEYFKAAKKAEESKGLKKLSRFLATMYELTVILAKTPPGQSIVIEADSGSVYRGRVKTDKLVLLPERLPGRVDHAVDTHGRELATPYFEWTGVPEGGFKTSWDRAMRPHLYREHIVEPIYGEFQDALNEALEKDPNGSLIRTETVVDRQGLSYHEITVQGFDYSVAAIESGRFVYYRHKGGEPVWC